MGRKIEGSPQKTKCKKIENEDVEKSGMERCCCTSQDFGF